MQKSDNMENVWILFSAANDYNQPDAAFEKLWWHKPAYDDLKEFGFSEYDAENLVKPNRGGETRYWVGKFTKPNKTKARWKTQ